MKFYAEGVLVAVEKGEFNDQVTGQKVVFYKNYLQCDDDDAVVVLGSGRTDFSANKGLPVVVTIDARIPAGEKLYKLTIREVRQAGRIAKEDAETVIT